MSLLEKTRKICDLYGIVPVRSKGQNFLIRESVYDDIVNVASISKDDTVLEVGPGIGVLTQKLAGKAKKVITVELDDKLAKVLDSNLKLWKVENIEILNINVLDFDFSKIKGDYKLVANLPYNITSVFLRKFLAETKHQPSEIILMLQKEVVQRIAAKTPKMSILAISVQYYADVEIIRYVPREFFYPSPKVESGVIKIKTKNLQRNEDFEKEFFRLVKMGFAAKRKMLKNNLASGLRISNGEVLKLLKGSGFDARVRAQELSIEDWRRLLNNVLDI